MYCIHCGKEISDQATFCIHCGQKQEEAGPAGQTDVVNGPGRAIPIWAFVAFGMVGLVGLALGYLLAPEPDPVQVQVEVTRQVPQVQEVTRVVAQEIPVEVTRVVQEMVLVEGETVEVTRVLVETLVEEVEVTRVVEVEVTRVVADESGTGVPPAALAATLNEVRERGVLRCGTGSGVFPGFARIEEDGSWSGINVDICRAVAAAVLGDSEAVEYVVTTGTTRFPILQAGEVDLLVNNTTWTLSRDTALGFDFAPPIIFDGQGLMVRADSGIASLADLDGGSICVAAGTTTEQRLQNLLDDGLNVVVVPISETGDAVRAAFEAGDCDSYSTDWTALIATSILFADPNAFRILPDVFSREPLAPVVRQGDDNWLDVVTWSINCALNAEELGIDSANVESSLSSVDQEVTRLLGIQADLGTSLGLDNDFCFNIIQQVGNFAEIYERHLGTSSPFNLDRGLNALWTEGGLHYAPPFR